MRMRLHTKHEEMTRAHFFSIFSIAVHLVADLLSIHLFLVAKQVYNKSLCPYNSLHYDFSLVLRVKIDKNIENKLEYFMKQNLSQISFFVDNNSGLHFLHIQCTIKGLLGLTKKG